MADSGKKTRHGTTRRQLLIGGAAVSSLAVLPASPSFANPRRPRSPKPNIVVIVTDDQRTDDMVAMPKTRALLGQEGTTYTKYFVTTPQCAPSRTSYFTGQLAHNHGVMGNDPSAPSVDWSKSLGVWMQAAGYFTSHLGKVTLSEDLNFRMPGFNDWFAHGLPTTLSYYDFTINDNGVLRTFTGPDNYSSDVLTAHAVSVIENLPDPEQPLFMTVAPVVPHDQITNAGQSFPTPAARYVGSFSDYPLPMPPNFNEQDVSDKPAEVQSIPLMTKADIEDVTEHNRARLAALRAVDDNVETIYLALKRAGRLENTIFVFTSDNGWMNGEHRYIGGKSVHYDPSTRVPLLIRGPGFRAGATCDQPVANIDLPATFVHVAGASPSRLLDGRSLIPRTPNGHDRVIPLEIEFTQGPGRYALPSHYFGARTSNWKYIYHTDTGEEEMYNLLEDPYELENVALNARFARVKAQMKNEAEILHTAQGDTCYRLIKIRRL